MNVVVLTGADERHDAFALTILEGLPEHRVSVVREPKGHRPPRPLAARRAPQRHRLRWWRNTALARLFPRELPRLKEEKAAAERELFGAAARRFAERAGEVVRFTTAKGTSLNDPVHVERIAEIEPDVIAVMGTGLVGSRILGLARLGALNQHAGLSPWYRGGFTNLWPLLRREPQYCGVTVHLLTPGIDSGAIVFHGRPRLGADDGFGAINARALALGSELTLRAIRELIAGGLESRPQWLGGRLYNAVDLTAWHARRYHRLLDGGGLARDLERAANRELPEPDGLIEAAP